MKNKQISQVNAGKTKTSIKEGGKVNLAKRSSLKLRTNAYKPIANRTRDKSPKEQKISNAKSPDKLRVAKGRPEGSRSKSQTQKQSNDAKMKAQVHKSKCVKAKSTKQKEKEKLKRLTSSNSFLDFWGAKVMGKREASLNASIRVNIMYEKLAPLKPQPKLSAKKPESSSPTVKGDAAQDDVEGRSESSSDEKKNKIVKKEVHKKMPQNVKSLKSSKMTSVKSDSKGEANQTPDKLKKRKSADNKCDKDEPAAKIRKTSLAKGKSKTVVKKKKRKKQFPSGHQLSNIIEKSPRQASLIAKAMIALEQEEECVVVESAARTRVFDWTELRTYTQNQRRQIRWKFGLGNDDGKADTKEADITILQKDETLDVDVSGQVDAAEDNSFLRTLHQVGDSRILKEYLRAQKEDFVGPVDVENISTPEKIKIATHSPKNTVTPVVEEKPEKIASPIKPQSCRVATPIPQLPLGHRTSHMTSYIHHPIPQPVYSQQHPHPQPIKVPPTYTSPAYIYQYSMDRQQGLYVPSSPSPVPYGVGNNDLTNDFPSTYTLSPMGTLSLRRGAINPYNTSLHLPVQHIAGFNYPSYYSTPLQSLSQPSASALQALHQRFPLVQPQSVIHALPQDMGTIGSYSSTYQSFPHVSSLNQDAGCMPPPPPPPPAHTHRPTSIGPSVSHQPSVSPIESLQSMNPVGIQPIVNSPVLDFSNSPDHQSLNPHRQLNHPSYNKSVYYSANRGTNPGSPAKYVVSTNPGSPAKYVVSTNPDLSAKYVVSTNQGSPAKYVVSVAGPNMMAPCKKEREDYPTTNCDALHKNSSNDCSSKVSTCRRKSSESSDVSDLLHSAHSAMYQIDSMNSEIQQPMSSTSGSSSSLGNNSPSKASIASHNSFNASYSVSSILDMPSYKIKPEPDHKMYSLAINNNNNSNNNNNNLYCLNRKLTDLPAKENGPGHSFAISCAEKGTDCLDLKKETLLTLTTQTSDPTQVVKTQKPAVNFVTFKSQKQSVDCPVIMPSQSSHDFLAIKTQRPFSYSLLKTQNFQKPSIEYVVIRPPKPVIDLTAMKVQKPLFDHSLLKPQRPAIEGVLSAAKCPEKVTKPKSVHDVIVIEDTDESSDDEPLAKLVRPKATDSLAKATDSLAKATDSLAKATDSLDAQMADKEKSQQKTTSCSSQSQQKTKVKSCKSVETKQPEESKPKANKKSEKLIIGKQNVQGKEKLVGISKVASESIKKAVVKFKEDVTASSKITLSVTVDDIGLDAKSKSAKKTSTVVLAKSKKLVKRAKEGPMFPLPLPRTNANHGWTWVGEGEMRNIPKLTLGREEQVRVHKCFKAMRHSSGEVVSVRDCVILQSDGDGSVPYVARVTCLWENLNGEMMFSMLWYYQPEHTMQGREPEDGEQELFASKHREENSVACIDDKCFVLMYNEYCRLEAESARAEQGVPLPRWRAQLNTISEEDQKFRRPRPPSNACVDNIWFCRYDYDIRKKIVKKPKHKKSNLRYRPPVKILK